jgi:broad specificity phosphatase PhoE
MPKTLILIRHGHRDNSRRELDNGLSDKGREQARWVKTFFHRRFEAEDLSGGLWLVSSPKRRCRETLLPLAKSLEVAVDAHPGLDEQGADERGAREGLQAFNERVHGFLDEWSRSPAGLTVLCSHGDWLPVAIFHLLGVRQEPKKGAWLELESDGGRAALKWCIPNFKYFYR